MKHNNFQKSKILLIINFVLVFFVFNFMIPVAAQTNINPGTETPTADSSTSLIFQEQQNDLELLNNKVDIMSEYSDRLMSTVQWTIGIVITVLIVILGANWFTTFRQIRADVETFKAATLLNLTKESELIKDQLIDMFDTKLSSFEKQVNSSIRAQYTLINQEIVDLRIFQLATEAKYWEEKGIWANAITQYLDIITLDPTTALITNYLMNLQNAIVKYGKKLPALTVEGIEEAMNLLSDSQNTKILSSKILELVKNQT